jgi:hypothetical protein
LSARCRAGLSPPAGDGLVSEPDGEASALAQGGIILPPVGHPMPLFRDVVAAIGIGFERQDWDPGVLRMEAGSSHVGPHSRTVAHGRRATAQRWPADPTESCSRKGYGVLRYRAQGAAQLVHATRSVSIGTSDAKLGRSMDPQGEPEAPTPEMRPLCDHRILAPPLERVVSE